MTFAFIVFFYGLGFFITALYQIHMDEPSVPWLFLWPVWWLLLLSLAMFGGIDWAMRKIADWQWRNR